ncbi:MULTISPECIES: hypothetical protein [Subtercola]|uniref:Uncharacterized protein n=1 Tax=Subtercola vilae TaxID=2056433 RepID=A0A4T2C8L3_9MICO|nr:MULTISPECIES: hypothetical protein [Subtercola]MEA9983857.1 hypothetical protein [Subtercola sp. RTI3]TIH40607.1 hypothetical protein D4765_01065 [Subtercola vilae]
MRHLHYVDGTLVVSFTVCEAVFHYAAALTRAGQADVVTIPVLWHGRRAESNLVLGPASQLYCTPADEYPENIDLNDAALVAELHRRARALGPRAAVPTPHAEVSAARIDFDERAENLGHPAA